MAIVKALGGIAAKNKQDDDILIIQLIPKCGTHTLYKLFDTSPMFTSRKIEGVYTKEYYKFTDLNEKYYDKHQFLLNDFYGDTENNKKYLSKYYSTLGNVHLDIFITLLSKITLVEGFGHLIF